MPEHILPKGHDATQERPPQFADDEIEELIGLLDALGTMSCARWDHGLSADEFGSILQVIQAKAQRCYAAAKMTGGTA